MIQMGWEDRTPFEAISKQFGISHSEFIKFMRKRTYARSTKHEAFRSKEITRFRCPTQEN